jgi:hypothetical protein
MSDQHFDLAAAALNYVAALKCGSFDDAIADLADAALTFANASPPDQDDDFSDCA